MRPPVLLARLAAIALVLAPSLAAQTGSFTVFGRGCAGSGGSPCISANTTAGYKGGLGGLSRYALVVNTGSSARTIRAFELYCSARNSTNMTCWIYRAKFSGIPTQILRVSLMPVTSTLKWHRTEFTPVVLAANTTFCLVFDNTVDLNMPIMNSGVKVPFFHSGPPAWKGPIVTTAWNYKVVCSGSRTPPVISNTSVPTINASYNVNLSSAPASARAMLAVGASKRAIDLAIIGAQGCILYTDPLVILGLTTDRFGAGFMKLDVPNNAAFVGIVYFTQYAILSAAANPAGLVFTAGAENKIGK